MTANECYRPPVDAQLRYTVQWFHEWSEMQRGDFLPILAQRLAPGSYVNGLLSGVDGLSCNEGRPPSLFQCRVKLFRDWFETWGQAERDQLLSHIKSMDPGFYTKMQEELDILSNHGSSTAEVKTNGIENSSTSEENHQATQAENSDGDEVEETAQTKEDEDPVVDDARRDDVDEGGSSAALL